MWLIKNYLVCLTFLISFTVTSCSTLPISNETQEILSEINDQIFKEQRFRLNDQEELNDKKVLAYLRKLLASIFKFYQVKDLGITVVDSYEAQAMVSFETGIYISKGMLYAIKNEAELIALLSHEVGHYQLKHLERHKDKSKSLEIIKDVVESTTDFTVPDAVQSGAKEVYLSQFNQRKEEEADEFGSMTASRLGYNPYLFADLFDRLSEMSDKNVLGTLKHLLGSHKSLKDRADHIREHLRANGIKNEGNVKAENYLKNVGHLGVISKTPNYQKAQNNLTETHKKIEALSTTKKSISPEEFINYMQEVRNLAKDLGLLRQLSYENRSNPKSNSDDEQFMMELVRVLFPWWNPADSNLETLKNILTMLGRIGVSSLPYVGDSIDLYEVLIGKDFLTDEKLSSGERVASALGLFAASGKQWRSISIKETDEELLRKFRFIKDDQSRKVLEKLAEITHQKEFSNDWPVKMSHTKKQSQGLIFTHPDNKRTNIRVMPGDPKSEFPNSRKPYVVQTANGKRIDKLGNTVDSESEAAHIPLEEYKYRKFW